MRTLVAEGVDDPSEPPGEPRSWAGRLTPVALIAAVAIGVALRFVSPSALWLDEALSVNIARLPVGDMLDALRHDGHPPFYYLLLHGWIDVFGTGDTAVRALSGLLGVAALPLAYVAGRRLAGRAGGHWTLAVVALSPFAVRYATETRMYSLVMLLVLGGYLLLTDARRRPTGPRLVGVAVVSGLLLLTHYWSFYLLGAVGMLLVAHWVRAPGERRTTGRLVVAVAAGGVLFLPWLGSFLYQSAHTGTPWGTPYRPTELLQATLDGLGGGGVSEARLAGTVTILLIALALFVRRSSADELTLDLRTTPLVRLELAVVALTVTIGWLAGYVTGATYQARYAAVFAPLLLVAVGVGITRLVGPARLLAGGSLLVLSVAGMVWLQTFERTQAEEVAAAVSERAEPGDVVVYCPDQLGPAGARVMPDDITQLAYPTLGTPERVDWVDYAERNEAADPAALADEVRRRADGNGIFVVWMGEYQTFGNQCEQMINALGQGELIVAEDGQKYYEPANVHWFPAGQADAATAVARAQAAAARAQAGEGPG